MPCPAELRYGDHLYVRVVGWTWRHPFRRMVWLRCWRCDLEIEEP